MARYVPGWTFESQVLRQMPPEYEKRAQSQRFNSVYIGQLGVRIEAIAEVPLLMLLAEAVRTLQKASCSRGDYSWKSGRIG